MRHRVDYIDRDAGKFLPSVSGALDLRPLSRAKLKAYADLATRAGRDRRGLFLLEGPRAIEDALARGVRFRALVTAGEGGSIASRWAESGLLPPEVPVHGVEERELAALADTATPQGVVAIGALPRLGLDALPPPRARAWLLVDGVRDPGNLGTLLRTLAAVGGEAAILTTGTVDAFNPKALRAAAGATFAVALAAGVEPGRAVGWCRERGLPVVALSAGGADLMRAVVPPGPVALAVGNETTGLGPEVLEAATLVAGLPMASGIESLSAAVAGSVAMYLLTRANGTETGAKGGEG